MHTYWPITTALLTFGDLPPSDPLVLDVVARLASDGDDGDGDDAGAGRDDSDGGVVAATSESAVIG